MLTHFPQAVPEIPVSHVDKAAEYSPVIVWLNLNSKQDVDELFERWKILGRRLSRQWRTNRGTCVSSGSRTWTAISCVCSTTSTGR